MADDRFVIIPHCIRHIGTTRYFILKRPSKDELKDGGRGKCVTTFYTNIKSARSLIVQVAVGPRGRKLLDEVNKNVGKFFNVAKGRTRSDETLTKS